MKIHFKKIAGTGLLSLALILPQLGYSQDSISQGPPPPQDSSQISPQQYDNPPANPPDQNDQQLDQQEAEQAAPPATKPVTTQVFYDQLAPYGQWVNYPAYGYVWIPSAVPGFTPYSTGGHWVYTTYGWTWVSDYSWGWATFHYGRWAYDNAYGWFWVPGTEWGPAWVAWRQCNGYYGWAPLCPGIQMGVGFDWDSRIPANSWIFVNQRYIGDRNINRYYEPRNSNAIFIRNSNIIRNTPYDGGSRVTYSAGPQRTDVESVVHTTIRPVPIHESSQPEQRYDQAHLHLYRPTITNPPANVHAAPSRSVNIQQVPQRNAPNNSPAQRQQPASIQRQQPVRQQSLPARSNGNNVGNSRGNNNTRH